MHKYRFSLEFERQQVSSSLQNLRILAVLNNVVIRIVSTCPLIFKSSSLFTNPLVSSSSCFVVFFLCLVRSRYLSIFHFLLILLSGLPRWQSPLFARFFSFLTIAWSGPPVEIRGCVCIINPRQLCASHSPGRILGCGYTTCSYGQIWTSSTIPNGSPFPLSRV